MMTVSENRMVSIRFNMFDATGNLVEERMNADPVIYLQGSNAILPSLQLQLNGMKTGDAKRVNLPAIDGLPGNGFYFDVVIADVREALPEELVLGYPMPLYPEDCGEDCECYKKNL
jgi:FKBP-type peptidyl-prolyl cis-trans isomerase 2